MNQNTQHLQAGTLLAGGKYRIVCFIGAGGFGCTYEAEFVPMGTRVAIKEFFVNAYCNRDATGAISLGASSQAALVDRLEEKFRAEAKRLFKLKHAGIVRVSDILQENGTSYYVMDYIEGRSLQSIIDQDGALPQARALRYIGQVMDALEYVHGQSMLHLDIKPDNIMVDAATDSAILIDFGVSKQYDEVDGHNTSTIMGQTPGYAPLEQVGGGLADFTPAADIYALGATLYCALTGCTPPDSAKLVSGKARLQPLPPGTSPAVRAAIGAMMQPNESRRPQTVAAVRQLLQEAPQPPKGGVSVDTAPVPVGTHHGASVPGASNKASGANNNATLPVTPSKSKKWLWAAITAVAVVAIAVSTILLTRHGGDSGNIALIDTTEFVEEIDATEVVVEESAQDEIIDEPLPAKEPVQQPIQQAPVHEKSVQPQQPEQPSMPISGTAAGHEWLDMGTSVKWATTNVGTSSPKGYGDYYAWGETTTKTDYLQNNSKTYGNGSIGNIAGNSAYDVASAKWGNGWRMPTDAEFQELIDNCKWDWYGDGVKITAKNGNVLFLPAAGYRDGTSLSNAGQGGNYWSATPNGSDYARYLRFYSGGQYVHSNGNRYCGVSVRPVRE